MPEQNLASGLLAVATCIEVQNMDSAYVGQKKVFFSGGQQGTLGEAWLNTQVEKLLVRSVKGSHTVHTITGPEKSQVRIMLEVYCPNQELIILGGGHIAEALAKLGRSLDYQVTVVDNRPEYAAAERFGSDIKVVCCSYDDLDQHITFGSHTSVVVATYGHQYDLACLAIVLQYDLPYVGAVGSRRKSMLFKERLVDLGLSPDKIDKLHLPIGLDIGAETPAEIALSIAAEILAKQRQGSGMPLSQVAGLNKKKDKKGVPLGEAPDIDVLRQAVRYKEEGKTGALATVVEASILTPRKSGAKMLVLADGTTVGTIGGGLVEAEIKEEAQQVMTKQVPCLRKFSLRPNQEQDAMVCGGDMEVFVEPLASLLSVLTKEDLIHAGLS
jgi:xanthine dehydrogenase accessory factor